MVGMSKKKQGAALNIGPINKISLGKRMMQNWELYIFVLPLVVYLVIFRYMPMYGVQIAFKNFKLSKGIVGSDWVGFRYFKQFFNSFYCVTVIRNTLSITLLSMLCGFPLPILLALLLDETTPRLKKVVQTVTFAPHFISTVVLCGMVLIFTSPTSGIFNHIIAALGGTRINTMQIPSAFKWVYILSGVWQDTGWSSIIYIAALSSLSVDQLEAARIDGASRLQQMWYVKLPTLLPTAVTLLILNCGSLMSLGYDKVLLLQNDANLAASEVISTYVYKNGLIKTSYSLGAAVDLFNTGVNIVMLLIVNFISKKLSETSLF